MGSIWVIGCWNLEQFGLHFRFLPLRMNNGVHMKYNTEKVNELIGFMQKVYAGWKNFSDPNYVDDEVRYKQDAIEKARVQMILILLEWG
jgi:hypothetical protein